MNQPPKNFIAQLFCKHEWSYRDTDVYRNIETLQRKIISRTERLWKCEKCGRKILEKSI